MVPVRGATDRRLQRFGLVDGQLGSSVVVDWAPADVEITAVNPEFYVALAASYDPYTRPRMIRAAFICPPHQF